jgi:hypothetical protein
MLARQSYAAYGSTLADVLHWGLASIYPMLPLNHTSMVAMSVMQIALVIGLVLPLLERIKSIKRRSMVIADSD